MNNEIDYDLLNKNKFYCYKCIKIYNKINELQIDLNNEKLLQIPNCGHYGNNFYKLCYCFTDNCWTTSRGLGINTRKNCCIHRENKEIFQEANRKSIETKRKNGTLLNGIKAMQQNYIGSEKRLQNCRRTMTEYNNRTEIKEMHAKSRTKYNQSEKGRENSKNTMLNSIKEGKIIPGVYKNFCKKCNKITLHNNYICLSCNPNNGGFLSKDFRKFNKYIKCNENCIYIKSCNNKNVLKNKWGWCENYINSMGGFNREEFYKNTFNIISFNSIGQEVTLEDFGNFKGRLGVWSRWTDNNHGNYCLDVCKSKDIGEEMLSSLRSFNSLKENPIQELDIGWKRKYMEQAKDADIFNNGTIIFKLVAYCNSDEEALKIEAQYAHDNKAKYWSPEPGQNI